MTQNPPRRNTESPPQRPAQGPRAPCAASSRTIAIVVVAALVAWTAVLPAALAQSNPDIAPGLRQALAAEVPLLVTPKENSTLRAAVALLRRSWRIPAIADRRVDPDRPVEINVSRATVETVVERIAASQKLDAVGLGPVVYLGPPGPAGKLLSLSAARHDEARKLPGESAARWLAKAPLAWPDLATPRGLLEQLAHENELMLAGLQRVPHDLWAGVELPPLSLVDRITLVAIQYDLTFQIGDDGASLALVPIPDRVVVVRSYPGGRDPNATADRFAQLAPEAEIRISNGKVFVRGRIEDHHRLRGPTSSGAGATAVAKPKTTSPIDGKRLLTISTRPGPLDVLLEQLGAQLGLEVRMDREALEAAGISPTQQVSLTVKEATIDQVFHTLLKPTGCAFRRQGNVVEVFPAR